VRLSGLIAAVATVGLAIAAYLTVVHYAHSSPICTSGGCEKVQHSSYAELAGVPVALLGLLTYLAIVATAVWRGLAAALAGVGLALVGAAFSGYLLWAQLARIDAICQWCLGNDVVIALVAGLCIARFLSEPSEEGSGDASRTVRLS
jgi:uncharacterized membrane protein